MQATVEPREVWLRGNLRPVAGMALLAAALVGIALGLAVAIPLPGWGLALVGVAGGTLFFCTGWLAWAAGQPRLTFAGFNQLVGLAQLLAVAADLTDAVSSLTDAAAADQP